jgi:hypothetical protein
MRLSLWCICAAILFALPGCDFPVGHLLEIKCEVDTGFDESKLCLHPERTGAELAFRVNETTQKVLITVIKEDGNWGIKDLLLENCSVVDSGDWKCSNGQYSVYAMSHGRYYHSLGGGSPDYYTSSIKGLAFLAVYYGIMNLRDALANSGYSTEALRTFGAR